MASMESWSRDYLKRLHAAYGLGAGPRPSMSSYDLVARAASQYKPVEFKNIPQIEQDTSPGLGSRILDIISRPAYAVSNAAKYVLDTAHGVPTNRNSIWDAAGAGLAGVDKTLGGDIVNEYLPDDLPTPLKWTANFAGTVALDPLSYVGFGGLRSAGARATRNRTGVSTVSEATTKADNARLAAAAESTKAKPRENTIDLDDFLSDLPAPSTTPRYGGSENIISRVLELPPAPTRAPQPALESGIIERLALEGRPTFVAGSEGTTASGRNSRNLFREASIDPEDFITETRYNALNDAISRTQTMRYGPRRIDNVYDYRNLNPVERRRTRAANAEWVRKHQDFLSPDDMQYIQAGRTPESVAKRIDKVRQQGVAPSEPIRAIDDWVNMAAEGRLTQESVDRVLGITGASNIREVPSRAAQIIKENDELFKRQSARRATEEQRLKKAADDTEAMQAKAASEADATTNPIVVDAVENSQPIGNAPRTGANTIRSNVTQPRGTGAPQTGIRNNATLASELTRITKGLKPKLIKRYGKARAADLGDAAPKIKYDLAMTELRRLKTAREAEGRYGVIRSSESSPTAWDLDFYDMFEVMPEVAMRHHFGLKVKQIPQSAIAAATAKALDLSTSTVPRAQKLQEMMTAARGSISKNYSNPLYEKSLYRMVDGIYSRTDDLLNRAEMNLMARSAKDADDVNRLTDTVVHNITTARGEMGSVGQQFEEMANIPGTIRETANEIGASNAAASLAGFKAQERVAGMTEPLSVDTARTAERVAADRAKGVPDPDKTQARVQNLSNENANYAESVVDDLTTSDQLFDLSMKQQAGLQGRKNGLLLFVGKGLFGVSTKEYNELLRTAQSVSMTATERFSRTLNKMAKQYDPQHLAQAANMIRAGATDGDDAFRALKNLLDQAGTFDTSPQAMNKGLTGSFFRNNAPVEEINKALRESGIKGRFDPDQRVFDQVKIDDLALQAESTKEMLQATIGNMTRRAELRRDLKRIQKELKEARKGRPVNQEELSNQWRSWDGDWENPLDFLHRSFMATQVLASKQAVGMDFVSRFGVSKLPKGADRTQWIKFTASSGDSSILPYIDKDLWYPRETGEWLKLIDKTMEASTSFRNDKGVLAFAANNIIDPFMSVFKPWVTVARPGHIVRNFLGDISINLLAGIRNPKNYYRAVQMFKHGKAMAKTPEGFGAMLRNELTDPSLPKKFRTAPLKNGTTRGLSDQELYMAADRAGLFPEYRIQEDLIGDISKNARGSGSKVRKALTENKYMRGMGHASEFGSHTTRSAQFVGMLSDPKFMKQFNTLEEAIEAASIRTRKFHPDVTGLTPTERKYMRRLIPFYSWTRQAIPVLMESLLVHPGRVNRVPQAIYSLALANGVNPDSYTDPFPTDQLFPSFIREGLTGPVTQGGQTMNLGSLTEGVLGGGGSGLLNGNILQNLVGQVNPVFKAPVELATKRNLGTGTYMADRGEYIDSQIPVINHITGLSGYSVSGSISNALTGAPGVPDPQRAMQKGEKDFLDSRNIANFLLGLGIQDTQRPSYKGIAAKEQANKLFLDFNSKERDQR